jgi:transcription antitermination factor NusG
MSWFALYTRPKNEKKVTQQLVNLGIEAYCPMVTQIQQWSDRKKKVEKPLISSYVFVNLEEMERNKVFDVFGVVRYLFWLGKPAIIKEEEIIALKESLTGILTSFSVEVLQPGATITIPKGPFQGKEGVVTQVKKNNIRLVLKELGILITIAREVEV